MRQREQLEVVSIGKWMGNVALKVAVKQTLRVLTRCHRRWFKDAAGEAHACGPRSLLWSKRGFSFGHLRHPGTKFLLCVWSVLQV